MSISTTVLFDRPQKEIASLIVDRLWQSTGTRIVTGFATPGGLSEIAAPLKARSSTLAAFIIGAATYPAFEALDGLYAAGVPLDRLYVHLGHTRFTGGKNHPVARFHPMLHSKVYYMDLPGGRSCAFIGSHNVTSFALAGLNGEAGVMLEGPTEAAEFGQIRQHIESARAQSQNYSPDMKEALAWWTREYIEGLRTEMKIPSDWGGGRTILLLVEADPSLTPQAKDHIYFEIPAGIEQVGTLKTEVHLFLFDKLPSTPWLALQRLNEARAKYTGAVRGAENQRGNLEIRTEWRIDGQTPPVLHRVASGRLRPAPASGWQQVRAELLERDVEHFEYSFEQERKVWDPQLSDDGRLTVDPDIRERGVAKSYPMGPQGSKQPGQPADPDGARARDGWRLVTRLVPRVTPQKDAEALLQASPESGRYILVALRRRKRKQHDT